MDCRRRRAAGLREEGLGEARGVPCADEGAESEPVRVALLLLA